MKMASVDFHRASKPDRHRRNLRNEYGINHRSRYVNRATAPDTRHVKQRYQIVTAFLVIIAALVVITAIAVRMTARCSRMYGLAGNSRKQGFKVNASVISAEMDVKSCHGDEIPADAQYRNQFTARFHSFFSVSILTALMSPRNCAAVSRITV